MTDHVQPQNTAHYGFFNRKNKLSPEARSSELTETNEEKDKYNDDIYLEERIDVPEPDGRWFSWRKLWLFTGPGWLSKELYIPPQNV